MTRDKTDQLIDLFEQEEDLWNISSENYHQKDKKRCCLAKDKRRDEWCFGGSSVDNSFKRAWNAPNCGSLLNPWPNPTGSTYRTSILSSPPYCTKNNNNACSCSHAFLICENHFVLEGKVNLIKIVWD